MPSPCSPRTRGWSRGRATGTSCASVLPAHAGMVPSSPSESARLGGAPRARGDGPATSPSQLVVVECSPRTRGWSLPDQHRAFHHDVLPAHAGMVPWIHTGRSRSNCAPRARGDGPRSCLLPSPERYARYCIDTARAWEAFGGPDRAVSALLAAERAAPQETCRPSVTTFISGLLYAPGPLPAELHALAAVPAHPEVRHSRRG
mgnify:CR=1 FL=1